MPTTPLIMGLTKSDRPASPEVAAANAFFEGYLMKNVASAETLQSMGDIIREFKKRTPRLKVTKCIDGRVHNSKSKGYPPGTVTFSRTEGNNVDLSLSNTIFWSRIDRVVLDAKRHTPGMPALFIALGHRSGRGHGCAAHGLDDAKALEAVRTQATRVREVYGPDELYVLHGMTNTDDMSESLIFPNGIVVDSEKIIAELDTPSHPLRHPTDVFQPEFLDTRLDDVATDRFVGHRTARELLRGNEAPMYREFRAALAMESYLVREVCRIQKHGGTPNTVIQPRIFSHVSARLDEAGGFPESLKGPVLYHILWNIAYALYQRRRLETLDAPEQEKILDHSEELVCYGDGFELLSRNECVLVKTGRGNDEDALRVARKVLDNNRARRRQAHPPLVHINVEVSGDMSDWDSFNDQVLCKIKTLLRPIYSVFGKDVRVLTSYSFRQEKIFYPVKMETDDGSDAGDPRECFRADVTRRLTDENFTKAELDRRQNTYVQHMLAGR